MYARGSDTMLRSPGFIGMLCSPLGSQTPILCNGKLPGDCQTWKFAPLSTISPPSKEAISATGWLESTHIVGSGVVFKVGA